jgi:putative PIN family toxin of toxin-antitoxin system
MRVCLDSNVVVAAFVARGLCADLLRFVLTEHDLVLPDVVVEEVRRVLSRKLGASDEALASVDAVMARCHVIPGGDDRSPVRVRDADDEQVLAGAIAGLADVLVTGDQALLDVADASPIRILSPRGFMTLVRGSRR